LADANRLKHAEVARIKAELADLSRKHSRGEPIQRGLTLSSAAAIRADLERARKQGDEDAEFILTSHANERAHEIARLHGEAPAHRFYRKATRTEETLEQLCDRWLKGSDYKEVTKDAHREALGGFIRFIGDEEATPLDVSRKSAAEYIDDGLTKRGLAQKTIRRKINSLSAFWEWIEVKGLAPQGGNPWRGHKISAKNHKGSRPARRNFTDEELIALLEGIGKGRSETVKALPDLTILGMYTGARLDELCSLTAKDLERHGPKGDVLRIRDAKTRAGIRPIGIVHPAPRAIIKRRAKGGGFLFPELKPGGIDGKLSHEASKAFGRQRRACGVEDGADFHSFRRQVATILERAGVVGVPLSRFLGQKTGALATDLYSEGSDAAQALKTAAKIHYSAEVEAAARALSLATHTARA
jgi:integrase